MKLRQGESKRKNGYSYRYTENGKRKTIYGATLSELRRKVQASQKHEGEKVACLTVSELVAEQVKKSHRARRSSKATMQTLVNRIGKSFLANMRVDAVRYSDARLYISKLVESGLGRGSISDTIGLLRKSFGVAMENYLIGHNPFDIPLKDAGLPPAGKRKALTNDETQKLLEFLKRDPIGQRWLDVFTVLLNTGMRCSELCGLTVHDLDFSQKLIRVDHQVLRDGHGGLYVQRCKTESGERWIPMTQAVESALRRICESRKAEDADIALTDEEGRVYTGFLLFNRIGRVRTAHEIESAFRIIKKRFNACHEHQIDQLVPHTCRHNFCTKLANGGVPVKSVQYLIGHASVTTTLGIYAHAQADAAIASFRSCGL